MKFTEIYGNPAKIHNKQVYSVSARNLILSVPNEWEILQICVAENIPTPLTMEKWDPPGKM